MSILNVRFEKKSWNIASGSLLVIYFYTYKVYSFIRIKVCFLCSLKSSLFVSLLFLRTTNSSNSTKTIQLTWCGFNACTTWESWTIRDEATRKRHRNSTQTRIANRGHKLNIYSSHHQNHYLYIYIYIYLYIYTLCSFFFSSFQSFYFTFLYITSNISL